MHSTFSWRSPRDTARRALACAAIAAAAALTGCASTLDTRVTAFHQWPAEAAPTSYQFRPSTAQAESLEYRRYQDIVRQALAARGLREATPATLAVSIDYGVTETTRTVLRSAPVFYPSFGFGIGLGGRGGGVGGVGFGLGFPFGSPWPGYVDVQQQEKAVEHRLRVEIDRLGASGSPRLFEGTATAVSPTVDMPTLLPALAGALFQDFPGPSGTVREVRVELPASR